MARRPPPIWILLLTVVLVYGAASVGIVRALDLPESFAIPGWVRWGVGAILIVGGMALLTAAIRHLSLRRAFGLEIFAPAVESALVVSGPYAYVRNPLYLGAGIALIGWTLVLHSVILVVATAFMFVHFFVVAKWEERELSIRLGKPYESYRESTPLFFPRLFGGTRRGTVRKGPGV